MGGPSNSGSNDNEVSGNEAFYSRQKNSKINKGVNVSTYGETKTNAKPADYDPEKDDTAAKIDIFKKGKKGAAKGALSILNPLFTKGSEVTRTFFYDKVLASDRSKKNIGYNQDEFGKLSTAKQESVYKEYIGNRNSSRTDAYGNNIARDGRTGETIKSVEQPKTASQMDNSGVKSDLITADKTAPTEVEMTQDEINVANKRGKKTRTVLTSSKGDTSRTTLGKKTLLG